MHTCVYVIITGPQEDTEQLVAQALAPFDEELLVAPYQLHLSNSGLRAMAEHYRLPETHLEALASKMPDWMGSLGGCDELGLFAIRTANPNAKWDWYEIGGRWNGRITGRRSEPGPRSADLIGDNSLLAGDLLACPDFAERLPAAVVTPTGQWVEQSTFVWSSNGWYRNTDTEREWSDIVRRILKSYPLHRVVSVDVHC